MYRRYWRYITIQDLSVVLLAVTFSSTGMALFVAVEFGRFPLGFSRMVVFNDWLVTLVATGLASGCSIFQSLIIRLGYSCAYIRDLDRR